jgi:hypothetical protein
LEVIPYVFGRTVQQHCLAEGSAYDTYRRALYPPALSTLLEPFHVVWLPTQQCKNAPVSHIVPVRPKQCGPMYISIEQCGATAVGRCLNVMGLRSELDWVQCSKCSQWFHCDCVGVAISSVKCGDWLCGCGELHKIK